MGDASSKKPKREKRDKKDKKDKKRSREAKGEEPRGDDARVLKKAAVSAAAIGDDEARDDGASATRLVTWDSFEATCFPARIKSALTDAGFTSPSEIQKRAWPPACEGRDVVAVAKTGSGKTLAFLLPTVYRLGLRHARDARSTLPARAVISNGDDGGSVPAPDALVLAPTRELAIQIQAECEKFGAPAGVKSACVYGGAPAWEQKNALKTCAAETVHPSTATATIGWIVVATPGRLCDLTRQRALTLANCFVVTLDEADRMLDMGFEPQLREVFTSVPRAPDASDAIGAGRQTTLFTATWPKSVRKLAGAFLAEGAGASADDAAADAKRASDETSDKHAATRVFLGGGDGADAGELSANKAVTQRFIKAQDDEKDKHMYDLLSALPEGARVVAFANTKRRVEMLSKTFWDFGFGTCAVHGDKQQKEREAALKKFTDNECPLMFATDVAARGLDIKGVTHVVNFDMARDVESYVHRIGRTGRAGELGESVTFWNPDYDVACSPALCKIARDAGQAIPEWLQKYEKGKESKQWKVADAVLAP